MSPNIKSDPERVTVTQSLQNMDQMPKSKRNTLAQGISNMPHLPSQDDELSSQDTSSLCSSSHHGHGTPNGMSWALNDADILDDISSTNPQSPEVQLLSLSLSQQLLPPTVGPSDVMYHTGTDFPFIPDMADNNDLELSSSQDFHQYSSLVDFAAFDNDACPRNAAQSRDNTLSIGQRPHTNGSQFVASNEAWNSMVTDTRSYHGSSFDQLSSSIFQPMPASPPLTESGNDVSATSACSHSGYPALTTHDDTLMEDMKPTTITPLNPADPLFPISPPLSVEDRNRTVRPSKQARRPALQVAGTQGRTTKNDFFQPLPARETISQGPKDAEMRNPRDHPYYSLPAQSDGKYYCPFTNGENPCNHPPTTQKCAYHKYLDSHLKPYRCKVAACQDAQLQFSSNACLFRHEREAHGLHGHGDNPHRCLFEGCDRSVPGYGFPRRWNLFDHMRRVHDYTTSERLSSPETSSSSSQGPRKRDNSGRKRRVNGASGSQTMKRTRPVHTQSNPMKARQGPSHHGQRLLTAERNYYNCRSRLLQELGNITPQDSAMHEKVNASLQELMTLGLNYRHIEASQTADQIPHGLPS